MVAPGQWGQGGDRAPWLSWSPHGWGGVCPPASLGSDRGGSMQDTPPVPCHPPVPPSTHPCPGYGADAAPPPFVLCTGRPPTHPSVPHTHIPGPRVGVGGLSGGGGSLLHQGELQDALQLLFLLPRPPLGFLLLPRRQRHGQAQLFRVAGKQCAGPPPAPRRRAGGGSGGCCVLGSPGGARHGLSPEPWGGSVGMGPAPTPPDLTNLSPRRPSCDMGWVPGLLLVSASQMVT